MIKRQTQSILGCMWPSRAAAAPREDPKRDGIISNERSVKSEAFGSLLLLGLRIMCQWSALDMVSSEDEDDIISPDEKGEHSVLNLFQEVVGQSLSGMLVEGFLEEEELARGALSCHLPLDFLCQEMSDAW